MWEGRLWPCCLGLPDPPAFPALSFLGSLPPQPFVFSSRCKPVVRCSREQVEQDLLSKNQRTTLLAGLGCRVPGGLATTTQPTLQPENGVGGPGRACPHSALGCPPPRATEAGESAWLRDAVSVTWLTFPPGTSQQSSHRRQLQGHWLTWGALKWGACLCRRQRWPPGEQWSTSRALGAGAWLLCSSMMVSLRPCVRDLCSRFMAKLGVVN